MVVQVDLMKSKLKPPGARRLKLKCDIMLSTSGFKFNLRRYMMEFKRNPDDVARGFHKQQTMLRWLAAGPYRRYFPTLDLTA